MKTSPYRLKSVHICPVRWPLRRPFVTSLGSKTFSDNVIVKARLSGGAAGYGEASSSIAMAFQTAEKMAAALRRLAHAFQGEDVRDMDRLTKTAWRIEGDMPTAVSAFEAALWDAFARAEKISFSKLWGSQRTELETLLTLSCLPPEEVYSCARSAARKGFKRLKLKINGKDPLQANLDRIRQARRAAPRSELLLDANQSFRPEGLASLLEFF
ncbi:MAG: hypothetical protein HY548_04945 [Elusimicrobia bacterium]|nr:hypothetical protein [Elusimicrobiota bacterium]